MLVWVRLAQYSRKPCWYDTIDHWYTAKGEEGIYCIWQDSQTIFGGKEATRFATDINDKHLSFDEKIPTLKSGKTSLLTGLRVSELHKRTTKEKSLSGATNVLIHGHCASHNVS